MTASSHDSHTGPGATGASPTLGEQMRHALRRWPVLLGVWVLVLALALLAGSLVRTTWTASTVVRVDPVSTNVLAAPAAGQKVEIGTERKIASSRAVAERAHEEHPNEYGADQILDHVSVSADTNTSVLTFEATGEDAASAAGMAQAAAEAYLSRRASDVDDAVQRTTEELDRQLAALNGADKDTAAQAEQLRSDRTRAQTAPRTAGAVITPASADSASSSPSRSTFLVAGLLGGLILGLLAAAVWDRVDPRIRWADRFPGGLPVATADAEDRDTEAALLWRRWGARAGEESAEAVPAPSGAVVVGLPEDEQAVAELAESLERTGGAPVQGLVLESVDAPSAEVLDGTDAVVLVARPRTRRSRVARLLASARRAAVEPGSAVLLR